VYDVPMKLSQVVGLTWSLYFQSISQSRIAYIAELLSGQALHNGRGRPFKRGYMYLFQ